MRPPPIETIRRLGESMKFRSSLSGRVAATALLAGSVSAYPADRGPGISLVLTGPAAAASGAPKGDASVCQIYGDWNYCCHTNGACGPEAVNFAARFCAQAATAFQKDERKWYQSNLPFLIVAAVGTSLGASGIAAAKAWGVLGGTSGIGASWKTETDQITGTEQAKLSQINAILGNLSKDVLGKSDAEIELTALLAAGKCASPVATATPASPPSSAAGDSNTPTTPPAAKK